MAEQNYAIVVHAVDEPGEGIEDRIGQAWGLDLDDMEAGRREALTWLADAVQRFPHLSIVDQEEDGFTIEESAEAALEAARQHGCKGAVLAVDSLQTCKCKGLSGPGAPRDPREKIELVTSVLRAIARSGVLVLVTSELGRASYKDRPTGKGRPQPAEMTAFKGSGAIEYMMTVGLVLSRIAKGEHAGDVRVAIPKNKRGEHGVVFRIERDPDRCTYTDCGRIDQGEERERDNAPKREAPPVDPQLLQRAREQLARHPGGIAGGLDGWASLCGVKLERARLACRNLLASGEAEAVTTAGKRVYRARK